MEDEEGYLDALQVLKDEDQNQDQGKDPDDERRPGSTETRVFLAGIRPLFSALFCRRRIVRAQLLLRRALHPRTPVTPSKRSLTVRPCLSIT